MTFHTEVLNDAQLAILPALGSFASSRGFYLGGGTATAIHLGHRKSVDFDWFSGSDLGDPLLLAQQARDAGFQIAGMETAPGTVHATIAGVRVSFLDYRYPTIAPLAEWTDYSARLASLDDLACMKLAAVAQRGSRKDFIDLHAIALGHRPISEILELYKRKYSTDDTAHLLFGLAYFDDAEDEPSPVLLAPIDWEQVKQQFREWARELAS